MNRQHTIRLSALMLLCVLSAGLVGCSSAIVGQWKAEPPTKEQAFCVKSAQFNDDGTFVLVADEDGEKHRFAGTYDFNGFKLTMKSPGKVERVYDATYIMGGTLKLSQGDDKLVMKKQ